MELPAEFIAQMTALLGEKELPQFLQSIEGASPVSIRYNPLKPFLDQHFSATTPIPWAAEAYYLAQRPSFTADPSLHAGQYYVQEAASMFLSAVLDQALDLRVDVQALDLCAAPGGKSTLIASKISPDSLLVSNEVIRSRAHILSENIQKWGCNNVWVSNNDPSDFGQKLPSFFDLIVVDAPCSGEGMFRKAPHSIAEWSLSSVQHCALRQQRILHDVWDSLKAGGILIYSTCTYNETENEDNLLKFRGDCPFESVALNFPKEWSITETTKDGLYAYRFYPHKTAGEGFFISVLKKEGHSQSKMPKVKKSVFNKVDPNTNTLLHDWLKDADLFRFWLREANINAIRPVHKALAELLSDRLRLLYGGFELAVQTRKSVNPTQAAALSPALNHANFNCIDLDLEQALAYLRLDTLDAEIATNTKDWQLMRYNGLGLGWIKRIDARINNYYTKEWKIRLSLDKLLGTE